MVMKKIIGGVEFAVSNEYGKKQLHFLGTILEWSDAEALGDLIESGGPKWSDEIAGKRHKDSLPKFLDAEGNVIQSAKPKAVFPPNDENPKKKKLSKKKK